jgi:putative flippase GtrA
VDLARHRPEIKRILRFGVVGLSNTALAFAVYVIALKLGLPYLVSMFIAYAVGLVNGYTWNRSWTFETGPFEMAEFVRYLTVQAIGLGANAIALVFAVESLGWGHIVSELFAFIPVVAITFLLNRHWTFQPNEYPAPVEDSQPIPIVSIRRRLGSRFFSS